ncbi:MAG: phospho-sugar mutase [Ruminococcaceae bacterium]|nr:phospho-sugar mutase [Oscillospiraceae bacterium]
MNDYKALYEIWCEKADAETRGELLEIGENENEIKERFYKNLEFGTAGLRGILGAGTNRMNVYTVRQATQGLADCLLKKGAEIAKRGVAISYDCRHFSEVFARESACVLAANGIPVWLYAEMEPTPALSFAVRHLKTAAGIMITASHNPANYNGYKVYGDDGAQMNVEDSETVLSFISKTDMFSGVRTMNVEEAKEKGLLTMIDEDVLVPYLTAVKHCVLDKNLVENAAKNLCIVYTPFHGTGYKPVMRALKEVGYTQVFPVPEQAIKDPDFSTVASPNPEDPAGFKMAIELAKEKDADVIIGTDPDSDRIGVLCKTKEGYRVLNGNQTGVLLMEYVLKQKKKSGLLPQDYVVSTVVSTKMVESIAKAYGVKLYEVYTGFKFIAGVIKEHEIHPDGGRYLFGFEESFGYLPGSYARDKDAVATALLVCEAATYYKENGMTIADALDELYAKYGNFLEYTGSVYMKGIDGMERMKALLSSVAEKPFRSVGEFPVLAFRNYNEGIRYDYETGEKEAICMPPSNVLYFELENKGFFILRPSGTEPKIKLYFSVCGQDAEDSQEKLESLRKAAEELLA